MSACGPSRRSGHRSKRPLSRDDRTLRRNRGETAPERRSARSRGVATLPVGARAELLHIAPRRSNSAHLHRPWRAIFANSANPAAAPAERDCCYIFSLICFLDAVKTSFAIKSLPCVQNRAPALHCAALNRNTFCVHLGGSHLRRLLCGNYYVLPGTNDGLFQRFNLRLQRAGY
jgi:hypothetical protein